MSDVAGTKCHHGPIEVNLDSAIRALAFSVDGECLVSGDKEMVRVWQVEDGNLTPVATMTAGVVNCLAFSKDQSRIAAGRWLGDIVVWDANTYEKVITLQDDYVNALDFSPADSRRLVSASDNHTVSVWDVTTRERVLKLPHKEDVRAAKYSPHGDRIATATQKSVQIFTNNGTLLLDIAVNVTPWYNTGLVWSKAHIFVVSDDKIKKMDDIDGSLVSECPVPRSNSSSCLALAQQGSFIAYSANRVVNFLDESSLSELGHTQHTQDIRSISLSPDGRFIAVGGVGGNITTKVLSQVTVPPTSDAVHHALATRALVRTRLRQWDAAISDAEESIKIHPSILAYIVKSIALVGKGGKHNAYRVCDIALAHFHSAPIPFLLLIKAIIVFTAGEHDDAISRVDNLIAIVPSDPTCYMVQAYMCFLVGSFHMRSRDYKRAVLSFQRAQSQIRQHSSRLLLALSLVFGWKFDGLAITIYQSLCEAFFAAGHTNHGAESLLKMIDTFDQEVYTRQTTMKWISDFALRCLSTPQSAGDTALKESFNPSISTPLAREWAKATLSHHSWQDALSAAINFVIPRFTVYRVICECLEADRVMNAIECLQQMVVELTDEIDKYDDQAKWVTGFKQHCAEELTQLGEVAINTRQYNDAIALSSAALSLNPAAPHIYVLRSRTYAEMGLWENAINETTRVLALDVASLWNYESVLGAWATKVNLTGGSWRAALTAARSFTAPRFAAYRAICEHLETLGHIVEAAECLYEMENGSPQALQGKEAEWFFNFRSRCCGMLENLGNAAMEALQYPKAISHYSSALSLNPTSPQVLFLQRSKAHSAMAMWEDALDDATEAVKLDPSCPCDYESILVEWAKVNLMNGLWRKAVAAANGFKVPRFAIYQAICAQLEVVNRIVEAIECVHEMESELGIVMRRTEVKWLSDFKCRCCWKLEILGDTAIDVRQYDEAITRYSVALSLNPTSPQSLYLKRSKAHAAREMWGDALSDANEAIMLDPSLPSGYKRKYVALRGAGHHKEAVDALEIMLLKMSQSADPETRELCQQYIKTRERIRKTIQDVIRDSPRVLINTASGRLCNKSEQAAAFEHLPVFAELIVSIPADHARIEREVKEYYRYATFSHKWEDNEPLFETVLHFVVYDLEGSPTHDKLQMFCKLVRGAGLHWAWSDTCCINKADHFVLQEALVAMFKWYQGSALTIIFLRGVRSSSGRGALVRSVWNTRVWTLQEYHASNVVRFYTEDWTPYLNLDIPNHKESAQVISEMEEATEVSAQTLMALRPGLDDIREKLCLASRRETTFVEDEAYSLLGVFSVSMPVVYGEGDRSLGRLLSQLLTNSGDTSILAWTGRSGSFNSCLPTNVAVFSQLQTEHIPLAIEQTELDVIIARLRASALDSTLAMKLYDRLNDLPVPMFAGRRMKLPCIAFKLGPLSTTRNRSEYMFRAQTAALGIVVIHTTENLSRFSSLYLIHPWVDFLLDRQPVGSIMETIYEEGIDNHPSLIRESASLVEFSDVAQVLQTPASRVGRFRQSFQARPPPYSEVASLRPPSSISLIDREARALQLITRLRKPFGALLLIPNGNVAYSRVAAESMITVQVEGITPLILNKLVDSVRVLDVL